MLRRTAPILTLALLALPASAAAPPTASAATTPKTGTTGPTGPSAPVPPPSPAPVRPRMRLSAPGLHRISHRRVALVGQVVRIMARVTPYVPGTKVTVRITRAGKRVKLADRRVRSIRGSRSGQVIVAYKPGTDGRVFIRATTARSAKLSSAKAPPIAVTVVSPVAGPGGHGLSVRFLQARLLGLHYSVGVNGSYDGATGRAVLAYRKVNGMPRTTNASRRIFFRLADGRGGFRARYPGHGRHVEGDLTHQVLALINPHGRVYRVFTMSSGKPSTPTVLGSFHFYTHELGTNSEGMVDSSYFIRGYAVHGYPDVPTYAASHGCLRIPIPNARFVHDWIRIIGERIDVYYR